MTLFIKFWSDSRGQSKITPDSAIGRDNDDFTLDPWIAGFSGTDPRLQHAGACFKSIPCECFNQRLRRAHQGHHPANIKRADGQQQKGHRHHLSQSLFKLSRRVLVLAENSFNITRTMCTNGTRSHNAHHRPLSRHNGNGVSCPDDDAMGVWGQIAQCTHD